jgi:hypothetical protein
MIFSRRTHIAFQKKLVLQRKIARRKTPQKLSSLHLWRLAPLSRYRTADMVRSCPRNSRHLPVAALSRLHGMQIAERGLHQTTAVALWKSLGSRALGNNYEDHSPGLHSNIVALAPWKKLKPGWFLNMTPQALVGRIRPDYFLLLPRTELFSCGRGRGHVTRLAYFI